MSKNKQIVQYYNSPMNRIALHQRAFVHPINHPSDLVSNKMFVLTSPVIAINPDGFETHNTIYKRKDHAL